MLTKVNNTLKKFDISIDFVFNLFSYGIAGVIGILLNVVLLQKYSSSAIGFFNQEYAMFMLLSQLAVGGIHLSVQRFVPEFSKDKSKCYQILNGALVLALIFSIIIAMLGYIGGPYLHYFFKSKLIRQGFNLVLPGLIFFSLNKVMMSYLNGKKLMKQFAIFQAVRFLGMMISLLILIEMNYDYHNCPVILTSAEIFLFITLFVFILFNHYKADFTDFQLWIRIHFEFGTKALVGNFLLDVNTRIGILILGTFADESAIGVYSFAANIAEGFNQLPFIVRNLINPIITEAYFRKKHLALSKILNNVHKNYLKYFIIAGLFLSVSYGVFAFASGYESKLPGGTLILAILLLGMSCSASYQSIQLVFNQVGMPLKQTIFLASFSIMNIVLNLILIPLLGVYGCALATCLAFFGQIFILKYMVKRGLSINI